jgi:iron-sulfur cluster insertion protein
MMNLIITDSAKDKLSTVIAEENDPSLKLRIFVQGGGCSGMQYGFTFDTETNEDDWNIDAGPVSVLVDMVSAQYLEGAEIDYAEDIYGSSFKIKNPNAQTSCGCGSSFSPY